MIHHVKVLVVDDDPGIADVLHTFLDGKGYCVEVCRTGREALDALAEGEFDLVVSDIVMADVDGLRFLQEARERHPSVGIMLMTAYEERHPLAEALRRGADGYISKPFTLKKFSIAFEQAYWNALTRRESLLDDDLHGPS
ncbi:MAG: response regulator [Candidatus Hydrogenedentes bacterium]|nr:response regulator [Candidatus Hydrogenedentota bacterium]